MIERHSSRCYNDVATVLILSRDWMGATVKTGPKTNAMRVLDAQRIPYEAFYYSADIHSAEGVAAALGLEASRVYKTLVVLREKGRPMLVMVPGDLQLHPKLVAQAVGEKSVSMASQKDAERLTGLQVGGISALALLNRGFDVFIDEDALSLEEVTVSGGKRGVNLRLKVADLIRVVGARAIAATHPSRIEQM